MYYVVGVDLGNLGDRSAVSVVQYDDGNYRCVHLQVWQPGTPYHAVLADTQTIVERIKSQSPPPEYRPNQVSPRFSISVYVVVDITVAGEAIGEQFDKALHGVRTYAATITAGTQTNRLGHNIRVPKRDLASLMRVLLEGRRFTYATALEHTATLQAELNTFELRNRSGNDNEIDWRVRPHDDLVLATALACWLPENGVRTARVIAGSRQMAFQ